MIRRFFGQAVRKRMSLGQTNRHKVGECVDWIFGGLGGQQDDQRC